MGGASDDDPKFHEHLFQLGRVAYNFARLEHAQAMTFVAMGHEKTDSSQTQAMLVARKIPFRQLNDLLRALLVWRKPSTAPDDLPVVDALDKLLRQAENVCIRRDQLFHGYWGPPAPPDEGVLRVLTIKARPSVGADIATHDVTADDLRNLADEIRSVYAKLLDVSLGRFGAV